MKNQALIDWIDRLSAHHIDDIRHQQYVIEAIENGRMHSWARGQDTTLESLERAKKAVEAYREGIVVLAESKAELAVHG